MEGSDQPPALEGEIYKSYSISDLLIYIRKFSMTKISPNPATLALLLSRIKIQQGHHRLYVVINMGHKNLGIKSSPMWKISGRISGRIYYYVAIVCHIQQCSLYMYMELPCSQLAPGVYWLPSLVYPPASKRNQLLLKSSFYSSKNMVYLALCRREPWTVPVNHEYHYDLWLDKYVNYALSSHPLSMCTTCMYMYVANKVPFQFYGQK